MGSQTQAHRDRMNEWVSRYFQDIIPIFRSRHAQYDSLPEATLSAFIETGKPELSITVPSQRRYTGRKPAIPSSLANTPCTDLGVAGLLEKLNTTLGTSYTLETPSLSSLESCISNYHDFGTALAHLRRSWYEDLSGVENNLRTREARDQEMRRDTFIDDRIVCSFLPLDMYGILPWGISHAWMDENDRKDSLTPINGSEWPVPIPKDAHLDLIRIEMLNLGAEYVWLDVLCLRQKGGQSEDLRAEEWKLDVPTIGRVYQMAEKVAYYFSGLGRPLSMREFDFECDRCRFRRAWTLQEMTQATHPIICGDTGDNKIMEEGTRTRIETQLSSMRNSIMSGSSNTLDALSEMQKRVSTNPVDRIVGLAYLLSATQIPAYYEEQSEEDAWTSLVNVMPVRYQACLLFSYPESGSGNKIWRPSWKQVMSEMLPPSPCSEFLLGVYQTLGPQGTDEDGYNGSCIESGYVRGLAEGKQEGKRRQGELVLQDDVGQSHTFQIFADHQYPIPEGSYTLIGNSPVIMNQFQEQHWVVGQRQNLFKKVSIFTMPNLQEVKRLLDLGIAKETENILD
ncbi:uncharacterized protein ARMOST_16751 [Armillaria ostoyae]|uniref:Heterokaryon incompatibility domain-containing protein n=1 Tax=Armillaria ostoyae TaxID=47428 RepID=A0A284RX31_ARMOS|nr:uncharacterized protein ARMOST_16751 [Armillaria ostoyae]